MAAISVQADDGTFAKRATVTRSRPHTNVITRLCDQGYESNTSGVKAVAPGAMLTVSSPVRRKIGQTRSSVMTPAMNQPRFTLGSRRLAVSATAR
jgi:hypothetical protein